ncbi:MAG: glycosyl hydrolase family 32 [Marmoricola sp.]|nr:glycosyl hydrolase family 32 [Marmoricola sp.]
MTYSLDDEFVWDFWTVYDEPNARHHLFYLHAPASLGDPELRHRNARVGHAVSGDLRDWTRLPDPLPQPRVGSFDELASWTGCAVRGESGWWLFTTGLGRDDDGRVQRIGAARSDDLTTWTRTGLVLGADGGYYQVACDDWPEEAWRDPWVIQGDDGRWHMYVTARDAAGTPGCGVVGHAVSEDLVDWEVQPPLSSPTGRFEWLEVIQVVQVEGRWVLLFSCLAAEMPGAPAESGGVWSVPVDGPGSPVDVSAAVRLTDESLYVGKVAHDRGSAYFLAFRNRGPDGGFVGGIIDPVPVTWRPDGLGLVLAAHQ